MQTSREQPTGDDVFDALSSKHRRRLLVALLEHNPQSDAVAAAADVWDAPDVAAGLDESMENRRIKYHHVHLPKLVDYGFVDWDRDSGEVTKGPRFEKMRPILELLRDHADELPADWL